MRRPFETISFFQALKIHPLERTQHRRAHYPIAILYTLIKNKMIIYFVTNERTKYFSSLIQIFSCIFDHLFRNRD